MGRIRGALRTNQPIEGAVYAPENQTIENGTVEELSITDCSNIHRDLSTWRTSIPYVGSTQVNAIFGSVVIAIAKSEYFFR